MFAPDRSGHRLAHHVVALRRPGGRRGGERIVVGVDGGRGGEAALRWGAAEAARRGDEVVVVHALPFLAELVRDIPPVGLAQWRTSLREELVDQWCRVLRDMELPFRVLVVERPVRHALVEVADAVGASAVVLGVEAPGSDRHRPGWTSGRTAGYLSRRLACPVVQVPAHAEDARPSPA